MNKENKTFEDKMNNLMNKQMRELFKMFDGKLLSKEDIVKALSVINSDAGIKLIFVYHMLNQNLKLKRGVTFESFLKDANKTYIEHYKPITNIINEYFEIEKEIVKNEQ